MSKRLSFVVIAGVMVCLSTVVLQSGVRAEDAPETDVVADDVSAVETLDLGLEPGGEPEPTTIGETTA